MIRKVISIDQQKCDGCGQCVPQCAEGALQMIDGKARLVSDLFCDGLGACLGTCPQGAIAVEEREAEPYQEEAVIRQLIPQGENTVVAHLRHLRSHGETGYVHEAFGVLQSSGWDIPALKRQILAGEQASHGCPGSRLRMPGLQAHQEGPGAFSLAAQENRGHDAAPSPGAPAAYVPQSRLRQWPVQLSLVPPTAPFLRGAELLVTADCVPFAYASFHEDLLKDKILLIGCPKLDDAAFYQEKLQKIFSMNQIRSVTVVHMEVPCCTGLVHAVKSALSASGKIIPFADVTISIEGSLLR